MLRAGKSQKYLPASSSRQGRPENSLAIHRREASVPTGGRFIRACSRQSTAGLFSNRPCRDETRVNLKACFYIAYISFSTRDLKLPASPTGICLGKLQSPFRINEGDFTAAELRRSTLALYEIGCWRACRPPVVSQAPNGTAIAAVGIGSETHYFGNIFRS